MDMEEYHYLVLELLRVCRRHQVDAMSENTALTALLRLRPKLEDGSILTADRLAVQTEEARAQANQIAYEEYAQLEAALLDGSDFRPALRKFLDKLK
jgi:hypothetical protein